MFGRRQYHLFRPSNSKNPGISSKKACRTMFCCQFKEWSVEILTYNSTKQKKRSAGKSVCKNSFTRQKPDSIGKTVYKIILQDKNPVQLVKRFVK